MSKKEIFVPHEEIELQKKIINQIKENNEIDYQKTGITKKMFIVTYGCQQNVSDSEKLKGMLRDMGYENTENKEDADIIIFNTCAVRENAELKVYGNVGALKNLKTKKPDLIIGVCGCMMQQPHIVDEIKKKYKHVDLVFGTHNLYKFPEYLESSMNEKYTLINVMDIDGKIFEDLPVMRESKSRAWVSIMSGCNNFCSYCIVPYVRGRERSRNPENIINEIKELASDGCVEISLLGQNVNSYGKDLEQQVDFADLLKMINEIDGVKRIRFMTSHPKDISDKLINTMAKCDKVCEQLHLPFQAGSNKILKIMNRKYTREEYLEKINKIKQAIPGISLSTDIIVGFPGETTEDFEDTLDLVSNVGYDQVFMFIYSKRKGTPAAKMEDVIDMIEKKKNFQRLLELQNEISKAKNEQYVGKVFEILVEGVSKNNPEVLSGRTRTNKIVNFKGSTDLIDKFVNVKITSAQMTSLSGEVE